jgi:hypothetical protein
MEQGTISQQFMKQADELFERLCCLLAPTLDKNFPYEILHVWSTKWNLFVKFFLDMSATLRNESNEPN